MPEARQSDTYETKLRSHHTKQNVKDEAAVGVPTYTTQISGYCTRTKYCNQIRTSDVAPLHCKMLGGRALFVQRWLIQCWFIVCFVMMLSRVVRSMLVCSMLVHVGSLNVGSRPNIELPPQRRTTSTFIQRLQYFVLLLSGRFS